MIIIIDLESFTFSHEEFNAGTIYQIAVAHPDKDIVYYAEREQIKYVTKLIKVKNVKNICFQKLSLLSKIREEKDANIKNIYEDILNDIFIQNEKIDNIIFTSCAPEGLPVLYESIKKNQDIKFSLMLHGNIELLIKLNLMQINGLYKIGPIYLKSQLLDMFRQLKSVFDEKKYMKVWFIRKYLNLLAEQDNVNFFVFSDEYLKYQNKIGLKLCQKFNKIFLPYIFNMEIKHEFGTDNEVRIGIMPSTAAAKDAVVWKIVSYVNRHVNKVNKNFKFVLFRGWNRGLKNTVTYENTEKDRANLERFFRSCDWILLPYPKSKYILSCSGVLFDSFNMEVPIIMYSSNSFNDFDKYNVGIRKYSIKELGEAVIELINKYSKGDMVKYIENIHAMKDEIQRSNIQTFKDIF